MSRKLQAPADLVLQVVGIVEDCGPISGHCVVVTVKMSELPEFIVVVSEYEKFRDMVEFKIVLA